MHILIVGGGIAGFTCAQTAARLRDEDGGDVRVTLVTATPLLKGVSMVTHHTKLLEELSVLQTPIERVGERLPGVHVVLGVVETVETRTRRASVRKPDGTLLELDAYDRMCLCTGARPKVVYDCPGVIGIRDTESVADLRARLASARRVVIVGNGGIAMELVHEIRTCQVVWCIKDRHVGNAFFDSRASAFLVPDLAAADNAFVAKMATAEAAESAPATGDAGDVPTYTKLNMPRGEHPGVALNDGPVSVGHVQLEMGVQLASVREAGPGADFPLHVVLTNGHEYACDFVVSATGVVPNTDWLAASAGVERQAGDGGFLVDAQMRTSAAGVYAAGDCCAVRDGVAGANWFPWRLWSQAKMMGHYAAYCLFERPDDLASCANFELFAHVTHFFGYKAILLGRFNAQACPEERTVELVRCTPGAEFVKFVLVDGRLVGAVLIGDTDLEGTAENLILNELDLSRYGDELLDTYNDLEDFFD